MGTYTRIDNRDVNCAGRKSRVTCEQIERTGVDILGWNVVREVDNLRGGIEGKDRALHRADEIILRAKISQESDDRHDWRSPQRHKVTKLVGNFSFVPSCLHG